VQYYKDAEIAIKKADQLSPNRQQNLYVYAKVKLLFGDAVGAVKMLKRAVDLDPESADPHYYYALMLWNTGTKGTAIEEYRRAVDLGYKPKDPTEGKQLGDLYGDAGEYEKALEFYQRAIFFDPSDVDANLKTGLVYIFMEKPDLGKPYLAKVLELLPDFKTSENYKQFQPYYEALGL
jgi:tetratricopeptide (TPR) repeat protein